MKVLIPGPLLSYTASREVDATGGTLAELLADLDRRYPGLRFRVLDEQGNLRPHMRCFINGEQLVDIMRPLEPNAAVQFVQALSGG